jgi:hypothetical protein
MKNLKALIFISAVLVIAVIGCNQPYYHIPMKNGKPDITQLSTTAVTPDPVTTNDSKFTVTATLPNAQEGDQMTAQILKKQVPKGGGSKQWLPVNGTKKQVPVGSDLKASATFTRKAAQLKNPGDEVKVVFSGKHDSAQMDITLEQP